MRLAGPALILFGGTCVIYSTFSLRLLAEKRLQLVPLKGCPQLNHAIVNFSSGLLVDNEHSPVDLTIHIATARRRYLVGRDDARHMAVSFAKLPDFAAAKMVLSP